MPNYATISRWVRRPHASSAANRLVIMLWNEASCRAAEIVHSRMDEIEKLPLDKVIAAWGRMNDILISHSR